MIEAFDRVDVAAIGSALGSNYMRVRYDHSVYDRSDELKALTKRMSTSIDIRQWSHERALVGANSATFIGEAREQNAGNKVHGGGIVIDGWYTLGWARDGGDWKLVYQAWQSGEPESPSAAWDHIFHNAVGFNHEPNRLLTTAVVGITPGSALDIATGQGRNALYLAAHGWQVTGVDISDEGLGQAREAAHSAGLQAEMVHADVTTYDLGTDRWDLVTLIYAPAALNRLPDIRRAVRPGGRIVYEYFAPDGPKDHAPAAGELEKEFAGWEIIRDEEVEDVPDWVKDRAKLVRFVARKK